MFQCEPSVAEGCSALNRHCVLDTSSRTFQMLQIHIEITVELLQTRNIDAMLFECLASVADSDTTLMVDLTC